MAASNNEVILLIFSKPLLFCKQRKQHFKNKLTMECYKHEWVSYIEPQAHKTFSELQDSIRFHGQIPIQSNWQLFHFGKPPRFHLQRWQIAWSPDNFGPIFWSHQSVPGSLELHPWTAFHNRYMRTRTKIWNEIKK